MITGPHFYEGLPLQSLAYRYPLLLVCWRQRLHCSSRLFCIVNISSEQCVQLFVLFNLALKKCSMDKFLFLASPDSRGSLSKRKTGTSERDRPCWVGGKLSRSSEGGKLSVSIFFKFWFLHISISQDPGGMTPASVFHRKQRRSHAALTWSEKPTEKLLNTADRKPVGSGIDYGLSDATVAMSW